jgi:hypothetical protein
MMPNTNNLKRFTTAWRIGSFVVILAWLPSATVCAQSSADEFRTAYESALLDSVLLYQKLKPVHSNLQKAYELRGQENQALRNQLRFEQLQRLLEKQGYEAALANEARKRKWCRWLGRAEGFVLGALLPFP